MGKAWARVLNQDSNPFSVWYGMVQEFQALSIELRPEQNNTGYIASRASEACHPTGLNWIFSCKRTETLAMAE